MIEPLQIIDEGDGAVSVVWSDNRETAYNAVQLRLACPCASCVNEWTGERILKAENVPADISFSNISIVGRYALSFHFSDGHDTGIFSFAFLRNLSDSAQ